MQIDCIIQNAVKQHAARAYGLGEEHRAGKRDHFLT